MNTYRTLTEIFRFRKIRTLYGLIGTFLLIFLTCMQVQAQQISLRLKDTSLKDALLVIRKQSNKDVFYKEADIKHFKVNLTVEDRSLEQVLDLMLSPFPLTFSIEQGVIVIKADPNKAIPEGWKGISTQANRIKGYVFNSEVQPIAGATIRVPGNKKATQSGPDGAFYTEVVNYGDPVHISYMGYNNVEMPAAFEMIVQMNPKANVIEEVVSVGYGSTRRKDLTGSVSSIDVSEIKDAPFVSIDQALAGKAPGVQVTQADGSPGGVARIRIRGGASLIGGNDPLYIIDGVQVQISNRYVQAGADIVNPTENLGNDDSYANSAVGSSFARGLNNLAGLNINDIETIDILKDASATAIYGSRAANGVVIITTKKGKLNQKAILEANYYTGRSTAITEKLLSTQQYRELMLEGAENLNALRLQQGQPSDEVADAVLTDPTFLGTGDTDWMDLITRDGVSHNFDLSMRGGGAGSRYYTSLAYNQQSGTLVGTDFSRLSGKVNLDNEINEKLRLFTNIAYGFTTNNITNGIYSAALFAPPTFTPYNADGTPTTFETTAFSLSTFSGVQNPMGLLKGINRSKNSMLLGSLALEYTILPSLKFKSTVSANYNSYHQLNYIPSTAVVAITGVSNSSNGGTGSQGQSSSIDMFYENTLTWDKRINEENRFTVLAGTTWQKTNFESFMASGQGYPDDEFLNGLSSAAVPLPPVASQSQNSLLSFYMRANYAWKEKYLFTFTGRSDESSKFPRRNRTGYFPSAGVAWQVREENFMKGINWLTELKLRASAGRTGTQNLGDNLFYTLYTPVAYANTNALIASQLGNDRIRWETTVQKDAGIDFGIFDSRIMGTIGYYEKNTSDLLMTLPVAQSTGFASSLVNVADISNKGLEIDIRGDIIRKKDFNWNLAFNISGNRSKVGKISTDIQNPNIPGSSNPMANAEALIGNTFLREGEPVGLIYGNIYNGVVKNQEQLDIYRTESIYAQFGFFPNLAVGHPMYAVFGGDSEYAQFFKRDIIGRAEPDYFGGITNSFEYKGFGLITLFTFSQGGDILYLADRNALGLGDRTNKTTRILDITNNRQNLNADLPTLLLGESNSVGVSNSSLQVHDASFLKLKSISFNYTLPAKVLERLRLNSALVYVSGANLFAITKYPGPDPEVSNDPYSLINGYTDSSTYPAMRQFTLGVRFGF